MADLSKSFKGIWMKGMEAIGDTASKIASNTRYKVNEMNMLNRRQEILSDFGAKAYALWQQGESFPAELDALLSELDQLETELNEIREARAAKAAAAAPKEEQPAEKPVDEPAEETVAESEEPAGEVEEMPVDEPAPVEETKPVGEFVDGDLTTENDEETAAKSPFEKSPFEEKADELADRVKDVLTAFGGAIGGVMERVRGAVNERKAAAPEASVPDAEDDVPEEVPVPIIQVEEEPDTVSDASDIVPEEAETEEEDEAPEQPDDGKTTYE